MCILKKVKAVYKRNVTLDVVTEYYGSNNNRLLCRVMWLYFQWMQLINSSFILKIAS